MPSPYLEAGRMSESLGNALQNAALAKARSEWMIRQQQEQQRQQQLMLMMQNAVRRQQIAESQERMKHYGSQERLDTERAGVESDRRRYAERAGTAEWTRRMQDALTLPSDQINTAIAQAKLADAAVAGQVLDGRLNPYARHNVGQNQVGYSDFGLPPQQGPTVLSPGQISVSPFGETIEAPRLSYAPAGSQPMMQTGTNAVPAGGQVPFKPGTAGGGMGLREISAHFGRLASLAGSSTADTNLINQLTPSMTNLNNVFMAQLPQSNNNSSAAKRPTRQQAAEYVARLGSPDAAKAQLQKEGFDISGYAD